MEEAKEEWEEARVSRSPSVQGATSTLLASSNSTSGSARLDEVEEEEAAALDRRLKQHCIATAVTSSKKLSALLIR